MEQLDTDQRKVLPKIEALLRLADKQRNSSPAEAAAAAAKAQELLLAYNLDASLIGSAGEDGRREDSKVRGGFYQYQRDLWEQVAALNFCLHFISGEYVDIKRRTWNGLVNDMKWEVRHRLIGRRVNVIATTNMAQYLQDAIERLVEERIKGQNNLRFSRFAMSYREGATQTICWKLYERRKAMMDAEEQKAREAAEAAARAGEAGASTETALTIASLQQSEEDANMDFAVGEEGYSARMRAERAARAEQRRKAQEEYTRWAEEHPEEARKAAEEARKEQEKREAREARRSRRGSTSGGKAVDWSAYRAGRQAAESISLDQQMDSVVKGRLK